MVFDEAPGRSGVHLWSSRVVAVPAEGDGGSGGGGVLGKAQIHHTNAGNKKNSAEQGKQKENS